MNERAEKLLGREHYGYEELCEIMRILRAPGGCPWDREQTHASIRANLIEETYEVVEGIDLDDPALMREELGDLLLQVIFHAQIAEEAGRFSERDVTDEICRKLILRHPHIFGDVKAEDSATVLGNWEKIKNNEKHRDTATSRLKSVPSALPALMRAGKVGSRAAKLGLDFASADDAFVKIYEELDELARARDAAEREEELGDLLFSIVNYARKSEMDSEYSLTLATEKFISRVEAVENYCNENGIDMLSVSPEELDNVWNIVKNNKKSQKN